jgi:hypothetical protein
MIIDIARYNINKPFVQGWYLKNKGKDSIGHVISSLACSTMCPCIVIAFWIGEITDWHPEALAAIERLTKFYGYKEIVNKPKGCPV